MTSLVPLEPGREIGGYVIEEAMSSGGMGVVFRARAVAADLPVVLKALRPEFASDPERRARFEREVRALERVDHPNLARLLEADATAPLPYLVLEPVEGTPLDEYLAEAEPPLNERVRIVGESADAVAAMHDAGIIHRDLKPSNILITPDGEPVVIDFGLARIEGEDFSLTRRDQTIGTPRYMAPEQLIHRIGPIGPATDVYQLGTVLYFLIAERPPLADESTAVVYRRTRTGKMPSPRRFRRDTPPAVEGIVRKAMAFRPEDRYPSARDLSAEIGRYLRGEPLRSTNPGWRSWLDRILRR